MDYTSIISSSSLNYEEGTPYFNSGMNWKGQAIWESSSFIFYGSLNSLDLDLIFTSFMKNNFFHHYATQVPKQQVSIPTTYIV